MPKNRAFTWLLPCFKVKVRGQRHAECKKRQSPSSFEQGVPLPVHGLCVFVIRAYAHNVADVVSQLLIYMQANLRISRLAHCQQQVPFFLGNCFLFSTLNH